MHHTCTQGRFAHLSVSLSVFRLGALIFSRVNDMAALAEGDHTLAEAVRQRIDEVAQDGLSELHLEGHQLVEIGALAGLTGLTRLWLQNNEIVEIGALAGLTGLTVLGLQNNN